MQRERDRESRERSRREEADGGARPLDAERELRAGEERFHFLLEDTPTMYFEVGAAGTITATTQYAAEHLGYTVSELTGREIVDIVHPADRASFQRQLNECARMPSRLCFWEFRKVRKDGTMLVVRDIVRPVQTDGELVFLIVCED